MSKSATSVDALMCCESSCFSCPSEARLQGSLCTSSLSACLTPSAALLLLQPNPGPEGLGLKCNPTSVKHLALLLCSFLSAPFSSLSRVSLCAFFCCSLHHGSWERLGLNCNPHQLRHYSPSAAFFLLTVVRLPGSLCASV